MTRIRNVLLVIPALALAATACGADDAGKPEQKVQEAPDPQSLSGRTFLSTDITENGKPHALMKGSQISLTFGEKGSLRAKAACNLLNGKVVAENGKLVVKNGGMTEMGCDPTRHKQDAWLSKLLGSKPDWKLEKKNDLVLTSGPTTVTLKDRKVADPDRKINETKWTLNGIAQKDSVSNVKGMEKAHLIFRHDTLVTGDTGCNMVRGPVKMTDGTVEFGRLVGTRMACSDDNMNDVERTVHKVLDGKATYEIDADTMKLTKGGVTLVFRAT